MGLNLQGAHCKLTQALTKLELVAIQVYIHSDTENWLLYFFACGNVMQGHTPGHKPKKKKMKYNTNFQTLVSITKSSIVYNRERTIHDNVYLGVTTHEVTFKFPFRCINKGIEGISKRKQT